MWAHGANIAHSGGSGGVGIRGPGRGTRPGESGSEFGDGFDLDEVVRFEEMRDYLIAFAGACYQNPKSICPMHQMITPRIIRDGIQPRGAGKK